MTLADYKQKYANKPKTLAAITRAISEHSENAEAVVTQGLPSKRKGSNMVNAAERAGFSEWHYYTGARAGRHANDGYIIVIVKVK